MSVHENSLLQLMQIWAQIEAGIMYYTSASELESNDAKNGTASYGYCMGTTWYESSTHLVTDTYDATYHSRACLMLSINQKTVSDLD